MVSIKKRKSGYFYLEHSYRVKEKVLKYQKYLGEKIPSDIAQKKKEFISQIFKEKWYVHFQKIRQNYQKEKKSFPKSALEKEILNFGIRFTYNTSRIEGSTLTFKETAMLIEGGISPNKPLSEIKESEAHYKIYLEMLEYQKELSLSIILFWHKKIFEATKPDIAGKIRKHQVGISGSKFIPPYPVELELLLKEFFDWYNQNQNKIHPVELASLAHMKFVTIHPFSDGNGRISRIIMNFILNKKQYPMLIIPYDKRAGYYNALEHSQTKKDETIFLNWFFKRYIKDNKKYLI